MNIKSTIINQFARFIIGGVPFAQAQNIVADLDEADDFSNEEKQRIAVARLQSFGYALAGFLVNLAIELAVAYLRSKIEEK